MTGANGFVGCHLVAHLIENGDEVIESNGDILDRESIVESLRQAEPDVVYHLAAQSDVSASWQTPIETLRVNAEGTLNVCDGSRLAKVKRIIGISSADVYGSVESIDVAAEGLVETTPLRPVSPYAASKVAAEAIFTQAHLGYGLDVVLARSFNHLGPGQSSHFVASAIASRIAENERSGATSVSVGNLSARRDFTDVRDVVRAYRMLIERGEPGETYNVCSGHDRSVQEIADQLIDLAEFPMSLVADERLFRPVDLKLLRGDNTKIRASIGWSPQIPLATTLKDLLQYWRQNPRSTPPQKMS